MYVKHHQKIVIVGAGTVGSAIAFGLVNQGVCDEIVLINRSLDKAIGEAMDLIQSIEYQGRNQKIWVGDYSDCKNAQIVIICAGTSSNENRALALKDSCTILRPIVEKIMASGFEGFIINVTNPVDSITHFIWRLSGLPTSHIIGTGTSLDTARLKHFIAKKLNIDPHSVNAYTIGEHGDSQVIPWSMVNIAGVKFDDVMARHPDFFTIPAHDTYKGNDFKEYMFEKVIRAGWKIYARKGSTSYGIASASIAIARSILYDQNRVIPCSVYMNGPYGIEDIFISVPTIISGDGAIRQIEMHLSPEEITLFKRSADIIKNHVELSKQY